MSTLEGIKQLVKQITTLSNTLSDTVPKGSKDDKIWSVLNTEDSDTPHETFNRRFDALFGEDCRDSKGRLHHICQGKLGMGLVISYLSKINWTGFPLELVELKLQRLIVELKFLQRVEAPRPARTVNPTAKLKDSANVEAPQLSFQRKAVQDFHTRQVDKNHQKPGPSSTNTEQNTLASNTALLPSPNEFIASSMANETSPEVGNVKQPAQTKRSLNTTATTTQAKKKYTISDSVEEASITDNESDERHAASRKRKHVTLADPDDVGKDGLLVDVDVQEILDNPSTREDKRQDVDYFFHAAVVKEVNGKLKKYRTCKSCAGQKSLVDEVTTLRRHLEASHVGKYHNWAKRANFLSKLPGDIKKRKVAAEEVTRTLDRDLREKKLTERIVPYSHALFRQAAVEWIAATDQPIQALEHPKYKAMIEVASRATNGVKIPGRKATRAEIMRMFKDHLTNLKRQLNDHSTVQGKVSLTCDGWQASNTDGYFAVTAHWIEELIPGKWELKSALVGFIRVNNAHHGKRLGQALFKVVRRMGITHKVGHVTCDNATSNLTMMKEFAVRLQASTGQKYPWKQRKLNCLAHVINLATQMLISTYSKSPHFDPKQPDAHIPTTRDEVGLIRAIVVKERSSPKRKEMWKMIQIKANEPSHQLILDMKVRWSSTYLMLDRAEKKKNCIETFIDELRWEERDSVKRDKVRELKLTSEEWERVNLFLGLLSHADNAQHAFSSESVPTLHRAIPALEALFKAWSSRALRPKYNPFVTALHAGCKKIDEYYEKTTDSPAYILSQVLDPKEKLGYFKKHWPAELQEDIHKCVEKEFKERWLHLTEGHAIMPSVPVARNKGFRTLLRELSDDEEEADMSMQVDIPSDPQRPWLRDYHAYIDVREQVPEGWTPIQWWALNAQRYHPAWGSIARDYLAVMSSSVSSERAFSQGGITISKHRNRLKGDIVEALQCIKCGIRHDLLFREPGPSSIVEAEDQNDELEDGTGKDLGSEESDVEEFSWDGFLIEDEDDEEMEGLSMDWSE